MKNICLVFPRFKYPSGDIPLGIAYLASYLKQKGIDVFVIDTTFNPNFEYVVEQLRNIKPDIVGIYMGSLMYNDALKVAKIAKETGSNVIVGGPHPTILPETVINNQYVDAICLGEGELTLEEYITNISEGKSLKGVKGVWFKENGRIVKNVPREPFSDLDELSFLSLDFFDIETYIKNWVQLDSYNPNLRGISLIVSRGCPFSCSYCQPTLRKIFGPKVRIRSAKKIVEELKLLKKKYKLNAFYFQDDTLTVFKEWIREFCELMIEENVNMKWACNTRADTTDREMLKLMKKAGLVKVKVGVEAASDRVRNDIYKKGVTLNQINNFIDVAKKEKLQITGFFMLGAPSETEEEIKKTVNFAVHSRLDEANFSITTPLPETTLYSMVENRMGTLPTNFEEYDYYRVTGLRISEVDEQKLNRYKKKAILEFYLHPKRIFNTAKIVLLSINKTLLKLKRF